MNEILFTGWTWYPSVLIGFSLWTFLYQFAIQRNRNNITSVFQQVVFHCGTLVGLLALVSPLDELGDEYLFSAHMAQHLLLMFVVAPLWLIGTPAWLVEKFIPKKLVVSIRWLTNPAAACLVFAGAMLFWHVPFLFDLAQENEAVHILEHLTYLGAGLIGWWPIAGPRALNIPVPRPPMQILYIFLLGIPCTALAAILTFAHTPLYSYYVSVPHPFGMNVLQDQQLGGLLMWIPTHMILLAAVEVIFLRWFNQSDRGNNREFLDNTL